MFKLKKPNSRFHALFTVRWNAVWMMPKHIFEKVADPLKFDFNKPVSLGAYVLHSYDPNGKWFIWQMRDDWQRTTLGRYGQPGPKYVAYVDPGPPDKRVIAQMNHELDIIHDTSAEGMFTLAKQSKTSRGWFKGFPYAHPDPTLPSVIFNDQNELFKDKRVRWALALLIDIKAVSMASYRGAATISAIAIPPTGTHTESYHAPMEAWLKDFELDTGKRKIKPYNPNSRQGDRRHAAPLDGRPDPEGSQGDREVLRASAGGSPIRRPRPSCCRPPASPSAATTGTRPTARSFTVKIVVEGEARPVMTRAGSMIAQQWRQFGIDAKTDVAQGTMNDRRGGGDFDTIISWSVETWGGHPDLSFFLDSWHSQFVSPPGKSQTPRNWQRWSSPALDKIIEQIRTVGFDDPKSLELGREFVKLTVQEMPIIPLMAYNVFTVMDETYWKGYPSAESRPLYRPGAELGQLARHDGQAQADEVMATCGGGGLGARLRRFLW